MSTVMITGAGRGIGLEFVRQYDADGWRIFACCRTPALAGEVNELAQASDGRISMHTLDVDNAASVAALKAELGDTAFDVLINNAGVMGQRNAERGNIDYDAWTGCMNTNVMGPMRIAEAFADNVVAGGEKKLVTVSSKMGSIGLNQAPNSIVYRSSKAAVNMVMSCLANDLAGHGVICHSFHPGWVRTDMGGQAADISAQESAAGMRAVISGLTSSDTGGFSNYDGANLAW
jgi:NAD(P)-dependent dehydrogenase (short-subunit alcohol dehydrogenase family)